MRLELRLEGLNIYIFFIIQMSLVEIRSVQVFIATRLYANAFSATYYLSEVWEHQRSASSVGEDN